jgi:hypothetical protein
LDSRSSSHLLEGTQKQNIGDAVRAGRMALGERNGSAKLTVEQVREIRIVRGEKWERVA